MATAHRVTTILLGGCGFTTRIIKKAHSSGTSTLSRTYPRVGGAFAIAAEKTRTQRGEDRKLLFSGSNREDIVSAAKRSINYAVVGLGHIAQVAVLPAFAHARRNSQLVTLVGDDRAKRREIAKPYRIDQTFASESA